MFETSRELLANYSRFVNLNTKNLEEKSWFFKFVGVVEVKVGFIFVNF